MAAVGRAWMAAALAIAALLSGCADKRLVQPMEEPVEAELVEAVRISRQWTGLAISRSGRMFVNFPRWTKNPWWAGEEEQFPSVAEVLPLNEMRPLGRVRAFPDEVWNRWGAGVDPRNHFVCVQSVYVDAEDHLWILDAANPFFAGVVPGGAKLVRVNPDTGSILQVFPFDSAVAPPSSYLNDVRVDTRRQVAYLTDSGAGALIVLDLRSGEARRLLDDHPSTHSEGVSLIIEGKKWRLPDGSVPQVHADGIALDPAGEYLYYQALTGRTLYRIATRWLLDPSLSPAQLGAKVENLGKIGAADGLLFGPDGRLYLTSLEHNAIRAYTPGGGVVTVARGPELAWPDSLAAGPDGNIYVTTSQIHRMPVPREPYKIFRLERKSSTDTGLMRKP